MLTRFDFKHGVTEAEAGCGEAGVLVHSEGVEAGESLMDRKACEQHVDADDRRTIYYYSSYVASVAPLSILCGIRSQELLRLERLAREDTAVKEVETIRSDEVNGTGNLVDGPVVKGLKLHPHVDVWQQVVARDSTQDVAGCKRVHATKDQV